MTSVQKLLLYSTLIVGVPALAAAAWWYYLPAYTLVQAEHALAAGDLTLAEEKLKSATHLTPNQPRAWLLYGEVLRRLHHPAEAENALRRAENLGAPKPDVRREFALAEVQYGFDADVEREMLRILQQRPEDTEILFALAQGYAQSRRWAEADRYYTRLLELEPNSLEARLARGQARLAAGGNLYSGRDIAGAIGDFQEVLRRAPDHYEAHLYLAHCYLSDARMKDAKAELLICQQLHPDRIEPLVGLASCALEERDYDRAQELLNRALDIDSASVYVLVTLGDLNLRRERFGEAIRYFREALKLDPREKGARLKLAQALRRTGQGAEAKEQERIYEALLREQAERDGP